VLRGAGQYHGTLAVKICQRKNDSVREGLFPRLGCPSSPGSSHDVVAWLKAYLRRFGLTRHPACNRGFRDRERCPVRPPVFCMTAREGAVTVVRRTPCSRQLISDALTDALSAIGIDAAQFSGVSARKGGLSTVIEAGLPECRDAFLSKRARAVQGCSGLHGPGQPYAPARHLESLPPLTTPRESAAGASRERGRTGPRSSPAPLPLHGFGSLDPGRRMHGVLNTWLHTACLNPDQSSGYSFLILVGS
jgi:hypothetical protein